MTATAISLGHGAVSVAYGFDAVWVTASQDGLVLRIDPETEEVTEHATGLERPMTIVAGPDSLWLTLFGSEDLAPDEPTVVRIDPADGSAVTGSPPASRRWARAACGRPTTPSGCVPPTRS